MWRVNILLSAVLLFSGCLYAQSGQELESIMAVLGTDAPEDIEPDDVERLSSYMSSPIDLNNASCSELISSELFSSYQIASLEDYIARHGNIMSFAELAAVDGFSSGMVNRLKPFIRIGNSSFLHVSNRNSYDISLRSSLKLLHSGISYVPSWHYGLKCEADLSEWLSLGISGSRPYDALAIYPSVISGNLAFSFRKPAIRIIIGDYKARFGQGLALWHGMSFGSFSSPSSFMKKPSGISPSCTFSGNSSASGVAVDYVAGNIFISVLLDFPDLKKKSDLSLVREMVPAMNVTWRSSRGHCSFTHVQNCLMTGYGVRIPEMKSSIDAAFCLRGVNLYGEIMYDWVRGIVPFVAGVGFNAGECVNNAFLVKYMDGDLSMAALCSEYLSADKRHNAVISLESVLYQIAKTEDADKSLQLKGSLLWKFQPFPGFDVKFRLSERFRSWGDMFRTDLRVDMGYSCCNFHCRCRFNMLKCKETGYMGYLEAGYVNGGFSLYLRQGVFFIDEWADRIYVSERDVPGSYNVPALYGRGEWTSLVGSYRVGKLMRIYLRFSYFAYPFMPEKNRKPGKAELKMQLVFKF
ncbi:MAG: hypothetical protein E7117_09210 [Bacteroidales bacterium]|nr:hypothetical protein [Bacteroidales bacterium]